MARMALSSVKVYSVVSPIAGKPAVNSMYYTVPSTLLCITTASVI